MESIFSGTCDSIGGGGATASKLGRFEPSSSIASALILSAFQQNFQPTESFITFISLQSSYNWYMKLSQFETVFLGLVMLQICFFRYLEVLPININNFFLGDPTGRRRRRKRSFIGKLKNVDCEGDLLTRSLFKVLRKLDDGSCLPLTLCELESMSSSANKNVFALNRKLPKETFALLNVLKRYTKIGTLRNKQLSLSSENQREIVYDNSQVSNGDNDDFTGISNCAALDGLQIYEEAVLLGSSVAATNYHNSTICDERYSACPLTKQDIQYYITLLIDANVL